MNLQAPGTLVLSAYAPCPDVTKTVTPDFKGPRGSCSTVATADQIVLCYFVLLLVSSTSQCLSVSVSAGSKSTSILYVRMGSTLKQNRMGGSALAQVLRQVGLLHLSFLLVLLFSRPNPDRRRSSRRRGYALIGSHFRCSSGADHRWLHPIRCPRNKVVLSSFSESISFSARRIGRWLHHSSA